jgi:hypothetical protein
VAPIELEIDRAKRVARMSIPGVGEARVEPIKNPASGEEHRAKIVVPNGFEYKEAEMGNTVAFHVRCGKLAFEYRESYAQLLEFDWSNA